MTIYSLLGDFGMDVGFLIFVICHYYALFDIDDRYCTEKQF